MAELQNATEPAQASGGTVSALLGNVHPCRLVERDGSVVGCWFTTSGSATRSGTPRGDMTASVIGVLRTSDGRAVGFRGEHPVDDALRLWALDGLSRAAQATGTDARRAATQDFVSGVNAMLRFVARAAQERGAPFAAAMGEMVLALLGWEPNRRDLDAATQEWAERASGKMISFLRTLDPWTLRLLARRPDLHDLLGTSWPGLDRTFQRDAPLRTALLANPDRARQALQAWPECASELRAAIRDDEVTGWLDEVMVRAGDVPREMLPDLADAEGILRLPVPTPVVPTDAPDLNATSLLRRASRLEADLRPRGFEDWKAFALLAPVYDELALWEGYIDMVSLLTAAGRDWTGRLRSLREACGGKEPGDVMGALDAMACAFSRQVLMPAVGLARGRAIGVGRDTWEAWSNAARTILFNGLPLVDMLRIAAQWTSADGFAVPADGFRQARWSPHLPDRRYHRILVHVITDGGALLEEVRSVHGARSGFAHHDALRLLNDCATGRSRVVSLRTMADDGSWRRVSVADVSLTTAAYSVASIRPVAGRPENADAKGAMARFTKDLRDGVLPLSSRVSRRERTSLTVASLCGYDWTAQNLWEASLRAWGPYLRPELRSAQPWQFARLAGLHMRSGPPRWEGHLQVPTNRPRQDVTRASITRCDAEPTTPLPSW